MPPSSPYAVFIEALNRLGCPYMVTGSVAATLYGEPRFTNDVDMVVELPVSAVDAFARAFPIDTFYCPPHEVLVAEIRREQRGHFNLIHHASGMKADIYLAGADPLHRWGLDHRRRFEFDGIAVPVAPPEYVILRKLEFHREGGSDKHIADCRAILALAGDLDRAWLESAARDRGLSDLLKRITP